MMRRLVRVSHVLLPVLVAGAAASLRLQAGEAGAGLWILMLGGALLGAAAALMLESVAVMSGLLGDNGGDGRRRRDELRRERDLLLRSLKDLELDTALQKLDAEQAAQLGEPLRRRALEVIGELERAQLQARAGLEAQIESELERRLGGGRQVQP